ncbi:MAG: hypothetical protein PF450_16200 [Bacteroidales bacterium]|nr:hypothetical protein [Bacteroidales bacterium]
MRLTSAALNSEIAMHKTESAGNMTGRGVQRICPAWHVELQYG